MAAYATTEMVDRLRMDLKEDIDAVARTVSVVLDEQRWVKANLRAVMGHLGVGEVEVEEDPEGS